MPSKQGLLLIVSHFKLVIPQIIKRQQQQKNKKIEKKGLAIFCEYYVAFVDYIVVVVVSFTQLYCVTK